LNFKKRLDKKSSNKREKEEERQTRRKEGKRGRDFKRQQSIALTNDINQ
jgi:hypothetical protein